MKGFEQNDIGLFTFYREQAEYQQKIQQQKHDKAIRKKHKIEQKTKQIKQQSFKNKSTQKNIQQGQYTQSIQKDHLLQAKKYIKQLQQSGHNKLIYNHKKRQKRYSNILECPSKQKLDITSQIMGQLCQNGKKINKQTEQIFRNKKDYSKFNYYFFMDKQVIAPKQFSSVQIFQVNSEMNKRQLSQDLLKNKSNNAKVYLPFKKRQKFPKISSQLTNKVIPNMSMPKKQLRNLKLYYNPLDIILNNQKFKLKQFKKIPKYNDDRDLEQSSSKPTQQNSVTQIMKKYRMGK